MPIFGVTASSNMSTKLTDFYQIATTTLGSNQGSVSITSIPSTYTHLQIRIMGGITTSDSWYYQVNGDTGNNYARHALRGSGASASSFANANSGQGFGGFLTAGTNIFGGMVIDILDYANTNKYKTIRVMSGCDANGSGFVEFNSAVWMNTAAITSIQLLANLSGYSWKQYSSFQLYGVMA